MQLQLFPTTKESPVKTQVGQAVAFLAEFSHFMGKVVQDNTNPSSLAISPALLAAAVLLEREEALANCLAAALKKMAHTGEFSEDECLTSLRHWEAARRG